MLLGRQPPPDGNVNALAELGLFSAAIMHEIKNALQGVANALFLLAGERNLSPKVREEEPVPLSLVGLLEEALGIYSAKSAYKNVRVERQYEFDGKIRGSPGALRQVFSNIILNALESAPFETGKLVIHTYECLSSENGKAPGVQIDFADNGPGIPEQNKGKIFEPLFSTKNGKGSGLGLWVAHRLILQQHGQIRLVSRNEGMNSGACFSVFLPFAPN